MMFVIPIAFAAVAWAAILIFSSYCRWRDHVKAPPKPATAVWKHATFPPLAISEANCAVCSSIAKMHGRNETIAFFSCNTCGHDFRIPVAKLTGEVGK